MERMSNDSIIENERMAKIGFFVLPNAGGMNACLQLAMDLKDQGHEVFYLGLSDSKNHIEANGFEFHAVFERHFPAGYFQEDISRKSLADTLRTLLAIRGHFQGFFEHILAGGDSEYLDLLDLLKPDLLVFASGNPYIEWPAAMSYAKGIPGVYFYSTLWPCEQTGLPPMDSRLAPSRSLYFRVASYLSWRRAELSDPLLSRVFKKFSRALFRRYRYHPELHESRYKTQFEYRLPEIVAWPAVFDFPGAEFPGRTYTEALICPNRKQPDFPWDRLDANRPLIYCALGTYIWFDGQAYENFFRAVAEAARRDTRYQWVLATGNAATVADAPDNLIVVRQAPQLDLLKRAAIMINHGGANSVKECIWFGVPMIMFPLGDDHFGITARVLHHGLGVRGDFRKLGPEYLATLVDAVGEGSFFEGQIKLMRKHFEQAERAKPGRAVIETLLAAR
jgi:zeaxanthin glucosyltransferase